MGLRRLPTVLTLVVLLAVFVLRIVLDFAGWDRLFVLAPPLAERPWTAATSVYAHADIRHLLGNAVALAVVGPLVARRTTPAVFHAYFVVTGAIAALAEVILGSVLWSPTAVLGASGAVFALLGYLLAGNVVSTALLDRLALSVRARVVLLVAVATLLTLATAGARTALFGHVTGLIVGLVAGRLRLVDRSASGPIRSQSLGGNGR